MKNAMAAFGAMDHIIALGIAIDASWISSATRLRCQHIDRWRRPLLSANWPMISVKERPGFLTHVNRAIKPNQSSERYRQANHS